MTAAGEGLRVGQAKQAETLGHDLMIVFHGRTSLQAGGTRAGRLVHWVDSDLPHLQAEAPDCQYTIPELEQNTVRSHTAYNAAAFTVTGSMPEFLRKSAAWESAKAVSITRTTWPKSAGRFSRF